MTADLSAIREALIDCVEYLEDMAASMDVEDTDTNCLTKYDGEWCGTHCKVHGCMNMRIQRARASLRAAGGGGGD